MTILFAINAGHALTYEHQFLHNYGLPKDALGKRFMQRLGEMIKKWNPDHFAVCFDSPDPLFRKELHPPYKVPSLFIRANCQAVSDDCRDWCATHGISTFQVDGLEADDLCATLAAQYSGYVAICSVSRLAAQCVTADNRVSLLRRFYLQQDGSRKIVWWRNAEIDWYFRLYKHKVYNLDVLDWFTLMGHYPLRIPGCPGMGIARTNMLLGHYGDLDAIRANLSDIPAFLAHHPPKPEEMDRIREWFGSTAWLKSRVLCTLRTDAPIPNVSLDCPDVELFREFMPR